MSYGSNWISRTRDKTVKECRADFRFVSGQWVTALLCNDVSHWPGASLEAALEWTWKLYKQYLYRLPFITTSLARCLPMKNLCYISTYSSAFELNQRSSREELVQCSPNKKCIERLFAKFEVWWTWCLFFTIMDLLNYPDGRVWINNYTQTKQCDVITHPGTNSKVVQLGHGWLLHHIYMWCEHNL